MGTIIWIKWRWQINKNEENEYTKYVIINQKQVSDCSWMKLFDVLLPLKSTGVLGCNNKFSFVDNNFEHCATSNVILRPSDDATITFPGITSKT